MIMTLVVGYTSRDWGFLAHSTRPRIEDGKTIRHVDMDTGPGCTFFQDGAVAVQGDFESCRAVHAELFRRTEGGTMEEYAEEIHRVQSARPERSSATVIAVGPDGLSAACISWGTDDTSEYSSVPPVQPLPHGVVWAVPPGCWPKGPGNSSTPPAEFLHERRRLTRWLASLGGAMPSADDVAARVGQLYRAVAAVSKSVAPVPSVAMVDGREWPVWNGEYRKAA